MKEMTTSNVVVAQTQVTHVRALTLPLHSL